MWAENCPENYFNRHALVEAEIARIEGRHLDAMDLYEKAIHSARDNGFVQNEALANELASRFYRDRNFLTIADTYFYNARHCYVRWGAFAKVKQLDALFPQVVVERRVGTSNTFSGRNETLDLMTVVKASQAVSGEIILDKLCETLLRTMLEHAGAERGLLMLPEDAEYRVKAEAHTQHDQVTFRMDPDIDPRADLPDSILQFVIRTRETVLIDDALADSQFSNDSYVQKIRLRSVLSLPIVKQARLIGVLYLENRLTLGAFTPDRLGILELLASQVAISLEHAMLFNQLEKRVDERTHTLSLEVAERTKAQAHLNETLVQLELILHNASIGICIVEWTSAGRVIRRANMASEQILGFPRGGLVGVLTPTLYVEQSTSDGIDRIYNEVLVGGGTYRGENLLRRQDGQPVLVDMVGVAIDAQDLSQGTIWLLEDVTERVRIQVELQRAKEAAESVNQAKSEFLATMSHEIRTPMNGILGMTQLVLDSTLADWQREHLEVALAEGYSLLGILNSILDFSKMEAGSFQYVSEDFSLTDVVMTVQSLLMERAVAKGIVLETEISSELPMYLKGDSGCLRQVLRNLVSNSVKFTEQGLGSPGGRPGGADGYGRRFGRTKYGGRSLHRNRHRYRNIRSDTAQFVQILFTADSSISRRFGGTGLGLAISKRIIEQQGGNISVQSTEGVGSRFTFEFALPARRRSGHARRLSRKRRSLAARCAHEHSAGR